MVVDAASAGARAPAAEYLHDFGPGFNRCCQLAGINLHDASDFSS
jgi:hypothetical protein